MASEEHDMNMRIPWQDHTLTCLPWQGYSTRPKCRAPSAQRLEPAPVSVGTYAHHSQPLSVGTAVTRLVACPISVTTASNPPALSAQSQPHSGVMLPLCVPPLTRFGVETNGPCARTRVETATHIHKRTTRALSPTAAKCKRASKGPRRRHSADSCQQNTCHRQRARS